MFLISTPAPLKTASTADTIGAITTNKHAIIRTMPGNTIFTSASAAAFSPRCERLSRICSACSRRIALSGVPSSSPLLIANTISLMSSSCSRSCKRLQRFVAGPAQRNLPQHLGQFFGQRMVLAVFGDRRLQTFLKSAARFHRQRDQVHGERQPDANARRAAASRDRGPTSASNTP